MKKSEKVISRMGALLEISEAEVSDIDLLMSWRMEALGHVFKMPMGKEIDEIYESNRIYYLSAIEAHTHIACFTSMDNEIIGCGGVCLQEEMPSPDNLSGRNAYIMNIYTRGQCRGIGVGGSTVSWLIERAKAEQSVKIYLETSPAGRKLYQKMGFKPMVDYLKL